MEEQPMSSSDLDSTSQTETEDPDTVDTSDSSNSTQTTTTSDTSTSDNASSSVESRRGDSGGSEKCVAQNVSVDFTEVSELNGTDSDLELGASCSVKQDENKKPKNQGLFSGLPKLDFTKDWFNHECFNRYWEHYGQCMSWCQKHYEVYGKLMKQQQQKGPQCNSQQYMYYPNTNAASWKQYPYHCFPSFYGAQNNNSVNTKTKTRKSPRGKRKQKHRKQKSLTDTSSTSAVTDSEFEMEITQDMIDFFAKSQEHRRQREKEKNGVVYEEPKQEHVNAEQIKVTKDRVPTVEAPKERPGARRTAEMKLLYGTGAAMIHGMETAVQMSFDRNTDIKQPKYWPNMPLKIVFG